MRRPHCWPADANCCGIVTADRAQSKADHELRDHEHTLRTARVNSGFLALEDAADDTLAVSSSRRALLGGSPEVLIIAIASTTRTRLGQTDVINETQRLYSCGLTVRSWQGAEPCNWS
jgi:hypothetical protein